MEKIRNPHSPWRILIRSTTKYNFYEASQSLTLAASDIYHPTQDQLTGAEISFGGDVTRSLKDNNYLVMECQAQAFKYWTPYPGQLRLHAFSHLASGALGILYWNWHSIHCGYETYWKGLLSHDLSLIPLTMKHVRLENRGKNSAESCAVWKNQTKLLS